MTAGPPAGPPAPELIAAGFELENADAPLLHHGMNLADLAHVLDLAEAGVIPAEPARRLLALLLETLLIPAEQSPYEPGRLDEALAWTDASPGGAGCVNGTRLRSDRANVARLLGFRAIAEHTRDAMWQTDGLVDMIAAAGGLLLTQSKLAQDLEIWASQEFDYVSLADGYSGPAC
jgi:argininosuccinate lyase